ncbi:MAG TPA: Uma2 family endonuclease [Tepidisphaeraceae bacterium]|jgi:Uma2 family endonuclease|nr:Uma2 family endonuclease [Tepidisphaeraceae bacterium]
MLTTEPTARRWSLDEYHRMGDLGFFRDQRVELIAGEILEMAPQGSEHFSSICLCADALRRCFGSNHVIRVQGPLRFSDRSEPEPDVAVVPGQPRDYAAKSHPASALLVVEVSDTSLEFDQKGKASLYARAGIKDYWIVNLTDRTVEVYRDPVPDETSLFGFQYADKSIFTDKDRIKPFAAAADVAVADLLP